MAQNSYQNHYPPQSSYPQRPQVPQTTYGTYPPPTQSANMYQGSAYPVQKIPLNAPQYAQPETQPSRQLSYQPFGQQQPRAGYTQQQRAYGGQPSYVQRPGYTQQHYSPLQHLPQLHSQPLVQPGQGPVQANHIPPPAVRAQHSAGAPYPNLSYNWPPPAPPSSAPAHASYNLPPPSPSTTQARRPLPVPRVRPESMPPPTRQPSIAPTSSSRLISQASPTHVPPAESISTVSSSPTSPSSHSIGRRPLPIPIPRSSKQHSFDMNIPRSPSPSKPSGPLKSPNSNLVRSMSPIKTSSPVKTSSVFSSPLPQIQDEDSMPQNIIKSELPPVQVSLGSGRTKFVPVWKRGWQSSPSHTPDLDQARRRSDTTMPKTPGGSSPERRPLSSPNKGKGVASSRPLPPSPTPAPDIHHINRLVRQRPQTMHIHPVSNIPESDSDPEDNNDLNESKEWESDLSSQNQSRYELAGRTAPEIAKPMVGTNIRLPGDPTFSPLPKPPPRLPGTGPRGLGQSVTLRFAALSMNGVPTQRQVPPQQNPPTHSLPQPPTSSPGTSWPANLPRLPRTPTISNHTFSAKHTDTPAQPQRAFVNLDDAPPPSLRSPSPSRQRFAPVPRLPPQSPSWNESETAAYSNGNASAPTIDTQPNVESPAPVTSRPDIPKISFPGSGDSDDDEDNNFVPSIEVFNADAPRNRFSVPQLPELSFSGPEISMSSPSTRNAQNLPPPVIRRGGLVCGGCGGPIIGRIVNAMGVRWHPACFKCSICNELLEHVSSYEHDGRPYCHLDYHETFAPRCYHCKTAIIDEHFITLDDPALGKRTYHGQHFFCAECGDPFLSPTSRIGELNITGDGVFEDDDVGFTVYKGHPYCEACHVRLRMPKCKRCKRSIRDGMQAVEALGGKWCWECFVCERCQKPFEDPSFFQRDNKSFCEPCFSIMLRNEV